MHKTPFKIFLFILICLFVWVGRFFFLPEIALLKAHNPSKSSFMKYREHQWREEGRKQTIRRQWVGLGRISPFIIRAVVVGEDAKFWRHDGFDLVAIRYALEKDIKTRKFALGGSTITQQLAKNLYLSPSKNPLRKIEEAILTWRIERTLSKRRIIELYLNNVEWGDGIFGVEAASERYFGHSAAQISARESAQLAAVLPNPIKFKPTSPVRYVSRRSRLIYAIMVRQGAVPEEADTTLKVSVAEAAPRVDTAAAMNMVETKKPAADTITSRDIDALLDSLDK